MREAFTPLMVGYPVALLGIFIVIATIFRSYAQPFVIMFTVPFGIIGAILGHLLMGYDLSIISMFGMVALTGVVVNDAIVLIERVNENMAEGMPFFEAIIAGGARRFRAIFLTTGEYRGGTGAIDPGDGFPGPFPDSHGAFPCRRSGLCNGVDAGPCSQSVGHPKRPAPGLASADQRAVAKTGGRRACPGPACGFDG
jgi:hypothetical protein